MQGAEPLRWAGACPAGRLQLDLMGRVCSDPCEATKSPGGPHTLDSGAGSLTASVRENSLPRGPDQLRLGPRPGAEQHSQLTCSLNLLICQIGSSKASTRNILAFKYRSGV